MSRRPHPRPHLLALAAAAALGSLSGAPAQAASCTWNPATGNWANAGNWTCAVVPGAADSATIGAAKTVTINSGQSILNLTNSGNVNIDAFLLSLQGGGGTTNTGVINVGAGPIPNNAALNIGAGHNVNNAGGVINVSADSVVNQFGSTISGGTINTTGTGKLVAFNSGSNFLDTVTLNGTLDMASAYGVERVTNGLVLNGTVNIGAASIFAPQGNQAISGTGSIVFADNNGNNRLNVEAGNLTLGSGVTVRGVTGYIGQQAFAGGTSTLTNQGTIAADVAGGYIEVNVNGGVTNTGTMRANNGGILWLDASGPGIANAGGTIRADNGGAVFLNGVTIDGGTLATTTGGVLMGASNGNNFLNNTALTANSVLDLATKPGAIERITGGLALNGTINIGNGSILAPQGNQTIGGNGTIVFADNNGNNRLNVEAGNLTLGAGVTVRGNTGVIGLQNFAGGNATLTNNGTIQADVNGGTITLAALAGGASIVNNGTLAAKNGGTLMLNSSITNNVGSQILAGAGSTVWQNGVTLNGVININGTGSFRASASSNNFLDNATFTGTLDLASAVGYERVTNGLVLNGGVNIANGSILAPQGNQTISGSGTIVFADNNTNNRLNVEAGNLTLGAGITVRGNTGVIGGQSFAGGNATLTNQGLIAADVSGGTVRVNVNNGITNTGTLQANNGGTLWLDPSGAGIANAGGTIRADNSGVVYFNGVTIDGGTLATSTGGRMIASNNSNNFLNNTTLNGVLDIASAYGVQRVTGGMVLGGAINVGSASILATQGDQTISGTGSIVFADANGSNRFNLEAGNLTLGAGVTVRGNTGVIGNQNFAGGAATLTNNGTINSDGGGTITINPNGALTNNGLFRAQNGTLAVARNVAGTGTLQVDATGTMNLANGGNTQGKLAMGAAGAVLNLGNGNLTITGDYTNAAAGSGNSFNRRAGVAGTGQIVAGGDVAQALFGTGITGGNTANATMTIGNVRVGANTFNYQIGNTGTTGPTLRGAIQTTAGGGNLTDGRLSGSGVTASNYSAGVPGSNSGNLAVTFTAASAGALAPLAGQVLNLRSNFENIADQKLNIVLAGGAAAYNAAVGSAAPTPIVIGNQRVGGSVSQALTVSNTAAAGNYSEDLSASFGNNTGAATNNAGTLAAVLAGSSNAAAMKVGVDTTSSGAKSGTVTLNYATTGAVNGVANNLGPASAGTQTINVSGNVYQAAAGQLQGNTLNFGTLQVGQNVSQDLVVRNTASGAAGFVEDLNASFGASGNSQITGSGALNGILAGTNSTAANGTMKVTVTGATAGALNSGIAVNYQSAGAVGGASNGLGTLAVGSEQFNVNGTITALANVINQASPQLNTPTLNLGAVRVGAASPTGTVSVTNVATAAPQAALNASITPTSGPISAGGSFNLLAPGATDAASLVVGLNTGTAGNFTGVNAGKATIAFVSDANNVGGCAPNCQLNLASQVVNVEGKVYTAAAGQLNAPGSINFGTVRVGTALGTQTVTIANVAVASALNDTLTGTMAVSGAGFSGNGASIAGLAAGGPTGSMQIGMDTSSAGVKNGSAKVGFISHNPDISDLVLADSQSVALAGTVNALADPMFSKTAGAANFSCSGGLCTLNMGTLLQGSGTASSTLKLTNAAAGPADDLTGSFDFTGFSGFGDSGFGPVSLAAGMDMLGLTLSLDTSALGSFSSGFTFNGFSHNAFQSDYALNAIRFLVEGVVVAQGGGNVPEPATLWLVLAAGAGGLAARRRAQRRAH